MNIALLDKIEKLPTEKLQLLLKRLPSASESQKRLFNLESNLKSLNNTVCLTISVGGKLDTNALLTSFDLLKKRHETLRTTLIQINGEIKQIINPKEINLDTEFINFSNLEESEKAEKTRELTLTESKKRFDLGKNPPWNIKIVRQSQELHILLLTFHQIIFDGLSTNILLEEIYTLYLNETRKTNISLPPLELQYKDYSMRESNLLTENLIKKERNFWRNYLDDPPQNPNFPRTNPRIEKVLYKAEQIPFKLDTGETAKIKELSRKTNLSFFMIGLTALAETVYTYTTQNDLIVSIPVAGRDLQGSERLIGSFVNMIPVRIKKNENTTQDEFLNIVKQEIITAQEHQNFPFSKILEALYPNKQLSNYGEAGKEPLFRIACDYKATEQKKENSGATGNLDIKIIDSEAKFTGCDLFVKFWEEENRFQGSILYNSEILSPETAHKISNQLVENLTKLTT